MPCVDQHTSIRDISRESQKSSLASLNIHFLDHLCVILRNLFFIRTVLITNSRLIKEEQSSGVMVTIQRCGGDDRACMEGRVVG